MVETDSGEIASETTINRLRELRRGLLRLHKALLDAERVAYERVHGQVSSGELLQLVIDDEQFAWLHSISELIVRIDEMLDAEEPVASSEAEMPLAQARALLKPSETGSEFEQRYYAALQSAPDAVLAHGEVMRLLSADR
jgi:hypothetical protein